MVEIITSDVDFFDKITNSQHNFVVIDFFTTWCGPCKVISPFFNELSKKHNNIGFYKIDCENEKLEKILDICKIKSFPTFCFFANGKYIGRILGADKDKLENTIIYLESIASDIKSNSNSKSTHNIK